MATERLWELFDAGESLEEIAGGYDMPTEQIAAATATIIELNPVDPWMYAITETGVRAIVLS